MNTKTFKAAVLTELKAPLEVVDLELPETLSFGQVLVRIHYSGICGAQINEIDGVKGPDKFLPHLLGHEASGTVEAVGPGVKRVSPGQRVVAHWRQAAGLQSDAPKYNWNGRTVNAGWVTTFNSHAIISENRLTPIPTDFDLRIAPLFGCAVTTAFGVINNDAHVKMGQSVVVFGVGGVGLNLVQAAAMVSANPIIGIDRVESKLAMARRAGATHVFNGATSADLAADVRAVVGAGGADVIVDTTGNPRVIEQAYALTHADGKTILVGVPKKGDDITIYSLPLHFKKVLTGSHGGGAEPDIDIPRYVRLVEAGKLHLSEFITHEFPLARINEALDVVRAGDAGRVLISMDPASGGTGR